MISRTINDMLLDISFYYDIATINIFRLQTLSSLYNQFFISFSDKDDLFKSLSEIGYVYGQNQNDVNTQILILLDSLGIDSISNDTVMQMIHIATVAHNELQQLESVIGVRRFDFDALWSSERVSCIKEIQVRNNSVYVHVAEFYKKRS